MAKTRLEEAQQEHIWAIVAAKSEGLSSSRVHQLLHTNEASKISEWLNSLNDPQVNAHEQSDGIDLQSLRKFQQRLAEENEVMRRCMGWLEHLTREKKW